MRAVILLTVLCLANWGYAQEFQLQAEDGSLSGPFEFKEGAVVAVGDSRAIVVNVKLHEDHILDAMAKIRIPEVDFRQANIRDVIDFLHRAAVEHGAATRVPSFILKLDGCTHAAPAGPAGVPPVDPFAQSCDIPEEGVETLITFSALDISLKEALDIVVDVAGLKWRIRNRVVMILPHDAPDGEIIWQMYDVIPATCERLAELCHAISSTVDSSAENADLKVFFTELGVPWPGGSSITYVRGIGKLVVANTRRNLETLEGVLGMLRVVPFQIEAQVQIVSFKLNDVEGLALTDVTTASLLALWERGGGELIAAPKVVTQAGNEATSKGVTEYIYPTEFSVTYDGGTNTNSAVIASVVTPGSFKTREVGAILKLLPELSTSGDMINVAVCCELLEEPVWHDYGGPYVDSDAERQEAHMPQPFFHAYNTRTDVIVKNGQRVLIGGGIPSRDGTHLIYMFLTVKKIGASGEIIRSASFME